MWTANISIILSTICHQPKDLIYKSKPSKEVPCNERPTDLKQMYKTNGSFYTQPLMTCWSKWTTALTQLAELLLIYLQSAQTREQANPDMTWMCGYMITISNATFQLEMLIDSAEKHTHRRRLLNSSSHVVNQGLCFQMHLKVIWMRLQGSTILISPLLHFHCISHFFKKNTTSQKFGHVF